MNEQPEGLRVSVSVSRKINLGNYQSADIFLAISGIEVGMTAEEMAPAIETSEVAFSVIEAAIQAKVAAIAEQKKAVQERVATRPAMAVPQGQERPTPTNFQPRR